MPIGFRLGLCLTAVLPLFLTGGAAWGAGGKGWYYGVSAGESQADIDGTSLDEFREIVLSTAGTPLASTSTLEDSDTPWSIFFGYQISPYFAFEAGYLDLGSFPYRATGTIDLGSPIGIAPSSFGYEFESKGYPVSVIGNLPIGLTFDLHARAGLLFSDTKVRLSATAGNESLDLSFQANASDLFYGAGAAMNLGERWTISVDWVQYKDVGDDEVTAEEDIDTLTLALILRIGDL